MTDFEACKMIEAFRCGVPSKDIGSYFSSARRDLLNRVKSDFDVVSEVGVGGSFVIGGSYGEGKTHMLNTIKDMAEHSGMAYSFISLGKETPMNNLPLLFQKVLENLYLPGVGNPGFFKEVENRFTLSNTLGQDALNFALHDLKTDKLYYVFKAFLGCKDADDHFLLQSDLGGALANISTVKCIYSKIFNDKMTLKEKFVKTKHISDYFAFISYLLKLMGYKGWVILFDEAELIGRFAIKSRMKAYLNMSQFLFPEPSFGNMYSVFAFSSSFVDEVLNSKGDRDSVNSSDSDDEQKSKIIATIDKIASLTELISLTDYEFSELINSIVTLHEKAYSWHFNGNTKELLEVSKQSGFLLRTKIRAAIEYLDQYFLYGSRDTISVSSLDTGSYEEDISLDGLFENLK